jgi:hypothetical protein
MDEVNLAYNWGRLKIGFISPYIRARGHFGYAYKLEGIDTAWTYVDAASNSVIYNSLPPGQYRFLVKAVNEDGLKSEKTGSFRFGVMRPFWQAWWFFLLVGLSGAALVSFISSRIIRNIRNQARVRNELVSSQLTAIRAQMNPHFIYNTLNSIQDLMLRNDTRSTNRYLSRFSVLMRKVLEFSALENVAVGEEVDMLENYLELEKLRFGDEFSFSITVDESIDKNAVQIPTLIIQPFVENAVKHGLLHKRGAKELQVSFENTGGGIAVSVRDNGVGRRRSAEIRQRGTLAHRSFATGAVQKRLELLNEGNPKPITCTITDMEENGVAVGTLVEIFFPAP